MSSYLTPVLDRPNKVSDVAEFSLANTNLADTSDNILQDMMNSLSVDLRDAHKMDNVIAWHQLAPEYMTVRQEIAYRGNAYSYKQKEGTGRYLKRMDDWTGVETPKPESRIRSAFKDNARKYGAVALAGMVVVGGVVMERVSQLRSHSPKLTGNGSRRVQDISNSMKAGTTAVLVKTQTRIRERSGSIRDGYSSAPRSRRIGMIALGGVAALGGTYLAWRGLHHLEPKQGWPWDKVADSKSPTTASTFPLDPKPPAPNVLPLVKPAPAPDILTVHSGNGEINVLHDWGHHAAGYEHITAGKAGLVDADLHRQFGEQAQLFAVPGSPNPAEYIAGNQMRFMVPGPVRFASQIIEDAARVDMLKYAAA